MNFVVFVLYRFVMAMWLGWVLVFCISLVCFLLDFLVFLGLLACDLCLSVGLII